MSNILNLEKNIIRIKECDSTNLFAKNLLSKSEPMDATVIITDKQTNGKGQFGNTWHTKEGKNLTFSIICKPTFLKPNQQFYLSKITAIACIQTLVAIANEPFKIKWPNDIYYQNKKIAGILIENSITSQNIIDSILGVGINVNEKSFNKTLNATSLIEVTHIETKLEAVFLLFLKNFQKLYFKIQSNQHREIDLLYKSLLLGINKELRFKNASKGEIFLGKVKGVNETGQLHLSVGNTDKYFNLKELEWVF